MSHFFGKKCWLQPDNPKAVAPNPDLSRWQLLEIKQYPASCVVKVKYLDATNFDGVKIMVYKGQWKGRGTTVDPHFADDELSPIARFKPTPEGWRLADSLARYLSGEK